MNVKKKTVSVLLVLGLLLGACAGDGENEPTNDPTTTRSANETDTSAGGEDDSTDPTQTDETEEQEADTETTETADDEPAADTTAAAAADGHPREWVPPTIPPKDEPHDTNFEGYEENEPIDPRDDNESTFAVDVDTGSYTLLRGWVREGHIPPPEAVRPEEFINFFDMGYPPPTDETFAIDVDGALTPYYDDSVLVRVGIAATDVDEEDRPDVNLTLVVDTSGSMEEGDRLELVKESVEYLVDELRPEDRIAIVEYSDDARVVLESTPIEDDDTILEAIDSLYPRASTNAEAGLALGYQLANETLVVDDSNMVLLLSDGVANVGADTPGGILETLAEANARGIDLLTVGVGLGNYNDELMEQLADRADGQYRYVDTLDEAERVFGEDLTGSIVTVAGDAKVQVSFDAESVDSYRLIGYENRALADRDFERDEVDAGEIGSGHTVTALYELELDDDARGKLGEVRFRWSDPDTDEVTEINRSIMTEDVTGEWDDTEPHYRLAATVGAFAEWIGDRDAADDIDFDDIEDNTDELEDELESSGVEDFHDMVRDAEDLL